MTKVSQPNIKANLLAPSTTVDDYIVRKKTNGVHYWAIDQPGLPKALKNLDRNGLTSPLVDQISNLKPTTMLPLATLLKLHEDYLDIEDPDPDFLDHPRLEDYLKSRKLSKLTPTTKLPYALLMGEDIFDLYLDKKKTSKTKKI